MAGSEKITEHIEQLVDSIFDNEGRDGVAKLFGASVFLYIDQHSGLRNSIEDASMIAAAYNLREREELRGIWEDFAQITEGYDPHGFVHGVLFGTQQTVAGAVAEGVGIDQHNADKMALLFSAVGDALDYQCAETEKRFAERFGK